MFRRSFKVFVNLALIALLAIWGFAFLRLSGPEETLNKAQAFFDRGEFRQAIYELSVNEHSSSLQRDPSKRVRLLRLRYAANSQLGNAAGALDDLDRLLEQPGIVDPALRLDRIRLLAIVGKGELALQQARAYLAENPTDGRALELAGEACQTTYRDELGTVLAAIDRDLGARQSRTARTALLGFLYRPDGDPEVGQGNETLRDLYSSQSGLATSWPPLARRLQSLRARVQEGLNWFQQSLEAGGEPVAALSGLALSLDQAERTDDLLALCEGYRVRFNHQYVFEAGAIATWAQIRAKQYQAALATALRWLPPDTFEARLKAGTLGPAVADLMLARAVAAYRLQDRPALDQLWKELDKMSKAGVQVTLPMQLTSSALLVMRSNWPNADNSLRGTIYNLQRTPVPLGQQDLLTELVPLRVTVMRAVGASATDIQKVLAEWAKSRPNDLEPRLAQAQFQLELDRPAAAITALAEAIALAPDDERVFALRVATANALYRDSSQDGQGLLEQCIKRNTLFPDVPNPIGYVLCAEAALKTGMAEIARASANYAIDKFPSARLPRLQKAKADLVAQRPAEAAQQLLQLLDEFPDDVEVATLALRAHRQANLPRGGLLAAAMRSCPPSPELTAELLRSALDDQRDDAAAFVPTTPLEATVGAELRILAAHALARANRGAAAEELLAPLADTATELPPQQRSELAAAVVAGLAAAAPTTTDADLLIRANRQRIRFALAAAHGAAALQRGAADLELTHPQTAYALCTAALASADPEQRCGADLALAGRLASRLGLHQLATDHWTAAITFPDGRIAAEALARQALADARPERAALAFRLVETPTDGALALRCGNREAAARLARAALTRDGADLLAHVVLACLVEPSLAADLTATTDAERHAWLELASLLDKPELGTLALPRAQALAQAQPASPTAALLLARALRLAGFVSQAAEVHARGFGQKQTSPLFWREVALAGATPGYVIPEGMLLELGVAAAKGQIADSPVTSAYSMQRTAETIAKAGNQGIADQLRAVMWMQFPDQAKPTLADAAAVAKQGRPLDAWWILDKIRPTLRGDDRRVCLTQMFSIAETMAQLHAPETELFCQTAVRLITEEGAYGCLVHFVLDHGAAFATTRIESPQVQQLLKAHVELAAGGHDPGTWLQRTIDRLIAASGIAATASAVDAALAAHPTSLPLWRHRAILLCHRQRSSDGVSELRRVLQHASADDEQLELVILAAAQLELVPEDLQRLAKLPRPLQNSATGTLAQGLVALRIGRVADAVGLLSKAAPQPDGLHLQALALAVLQSQAPNAQARAAATFAKLAADYPSSSLARYASSFARQLAPR